jgi:hypothetical protein
MATDCIAQVTFEFDPKGKPVVAAFDAETASSDGGAIFDQAREVPVSTTEIDNALNCIAVAETPGGTHGRRGCFPSLSGARRNGRTPSAARAQSYAAPGMHCARLRLGPVIRIGSPLLDPDVAEVDWISMALQLDRAGDSGFVLAPRCGAFA